MKTAQDFSFGGLILRGVIKAEGLMKLHSECKHCHNRCPISRRLRDQIRLEKGRDTMAESHCSGGVDVCQSYLLFVCLIDFFDESKVVLCDVLFINDLTLELELHLLLFLHGACMTCRAGQDIDIISIS